MAKAHQSIGCRSHLRGNDTGEIKLAGSDARPGNTPSNTQSNGLIFAVLITRPK